MAALEAQRECGGTAWDGSQPRLQRVWPRDGAPWTILPWCRD